MHTFCLPLKLHSHFYLRGTSIYLSSVLQGLAPFLAPQEILILRPISLSFLNPSKASSLYDILLHHILYCLALFLAGTCMLVLSPWECKLLKGRDYVFNFVSTTVPSTVLGTWVLNKYFVYWSANYLVFLIKGINTCACKLIPTCWGLWLSWRRVEQHWPWSRTVVWWSGKQATTVTTRRYDRGRTDSYVHRPSQSS